MPTLRIINQRPQLGTCFVIIVSLCILICLVLKKLISHLLGSIWAFFLLNGDILTFSVNCFVICAQKVDCGSHGIVISVFEDVHLVGCQIGNLYC